MRIEDEASHDAAHPQPGKIASSTWYVMASLVVIYALAHLDRQILSLLVEPLKHDLHLSDTQVSLLQGFAFAAFMAVAGLPIGRLMDLKRRTAVMAVGVATWGAATMGCGFVSSYAGLVVLRMGVGAGEAVLTPGAHSIIAETAPANRLGLAMGLFGIGSFIGVGLAFVVGAFVLAGVAHLGPISLPGREPFKVWQLVFLAVGAPALPMALWALSLPEPVRPVLASGADRSLRTALRFFSTHYASVGVVNLTGGFVGVASYAASAWFPTFLIRTFHVSASTVGLEYGFMVMICGAFGVVAGGLAGDFAVARGHASGRLMVMGLTAACATPLVCAAPLMASPLSSFALLAPATFLMTMALGLLPSVQQAIIPSHLRGSASALGTLTVNLIGLGLGPTLVALATDKLFHSPAAVGRSLALVAPLALLIAAVCAIAGRRAYARDLALS